MTEIEHAPVVSGPVLTHRRSIADIFERALWTLVQVATGTGIVEGYQALPLPNIPDPYVILVVIVLSALLSSVKTVLAQKFGNGTGATLPEQLEPVPPEQVVVQETSSGLAVAGPAYLEDENGDDVPVGTPVDVAPIEPTEDGEPTPGDTDADEVHEDLPMPDGFDDGSNPEVGRRYLDDDGDGEPDARP